jgi:D-alanyl-D-alanine carboxypeptidase/D-alanyl-D-alanine carboxypeptidase (penicillin-binding protein 5/6)
MIKHNRLLREGVGVIAGKTGFTKRSGRTLVTLAERDGLRLICCTLNASDDWNDHKKLYEFGFQSYQRTNFEPISFKIPIISGNQGYITLKSDAISLFTAKNQGEVTYRVTAPRFVFAPVKKGDTVGQVIFMQNGKRIASLPLVASEDCNRISYGFNLFEWLKEIFSKLRM